ncbi:MAG: hypothetical protein WCG25_02195 [bacterium]
MIDHLALFDISLKTLNSEFLNTSFISINSIPNLRSGLSVQYLSKASTYFILTKSVTIFLFGTNLIVMSFINHSTTSYTSCCSINDISQSI